MIYRLNDGSYLIKTILLLIIVALFAQACSNSELNYDTIVLQGDDFISLQADKNASCIDVITLESSSECMIGDGFQLKTYNNNFYVLDKDATQKLFHFDEEGSFVKSIGKTGKGPGEYVILHDFLVTDEGIELLCGFPDTEVYYYDFQGDFQNKRKVYDFMVSFSFINKPNSKDYYLYSPHAAYKVGHYSIESEFKVDSMLPAKFGSDMIFQYYPFSETTDHTILFNEPYGNIVYELSSAGSKEKYLLDYGKFNLDPDITLPELMKLGKEFGLWEVKKILDNQNFLYICADKMLPGDVLIRNHFLYQKKNRKMFKLSDESDFGRILNPGFALNSEDELFLPLLPSLAVGTRFWDSYFNEQGHKVELYDNPIIVKLSLDKMI